MHWWLDNVIKEDESKIMYQYNARNLPRIGQMCMNFIKLVDLKGTLKKRQLKCALNIELERWYYLALKHLQRTYREFNYMYFSLYQLLKYW